MASGDSGHELDGPRCFANLHEPSRTNAPTSYPPLACRTCMPRGQRASDRASSPSDYRRPGSRPQRPQRCSADSYWHGQPALLPDWPLALRPLSPPKRSPSPAHPLSPSKPQIIPPHGPPPRNPVRRASQVLALSRQSWSCSRSPSVQWK